MKRRRRVNSGVDGAKLSRSKRKKFEHHEKKARRMSLHGGSKSIIQKEMERICKKLNIGQTPNVPDSPVPKPQEVPKEVTRKELKEVRKMNFLLDNREEEKNIKKLEKKLFLNKRRNTNMPRSFIDEGLDYILELTDEKYKERALDTETGADVKSFGNSKKKTPHISEERKTMGIKANEMDQEDIDSSKFSSQSSDEEGDQSEDDVDSEAGVRKVEDYEGEVDESIEEEGVEAGGGGDGKDRDEMWEDIYGRKRDRKGNVVVEKYLPPAKRSLVLSAERKRQLQTLKKQLKGAFNRLSESTVQSIGAQVEELYRKCSSNDVNSTLLEVLCEAIITPFLNPQRLVMEHAMLVAYLHWNVAPQVGAFILENLATKFDSLYEHMLNTGKEVDNCVLFLAYLFMFKVTHARLIYDIIRRLTASFGARDVELILSILRSAGFGLRKRDPVALKETMISLQQKCMQDSDQDQRKKFMLDVLMAIKNNNIQKIPNCDPSMVEHASKILHSLCRKGNAMQELNISLLDLLHAKERGKWWLVGSAWTPQDACASSECKVKAAVSEAFSSKIVQLAKQQHMNTDIRRNVFCIIMSAEDYLDASEKILRLNLSGTQLREVCYVLLHCCIKEKNYNPYYAVLAKFFCKRDRRFQMSLQCAIWDRMKELEKMSRTASSNLALFLKTHLCRHVLSLAVFKVVQFVDMNPSLVRFLRQVFISLFTSEAGDVIHKLFSHIAQAPKLRLLREGLRLFLRQLRETDDPKQRELLQKSVLEAESALADKSDL